MAFWLLECIRDFYHGINRACRLMKSTVTWRDTICIKILVCVPWYFWNLNSLLLIWAWEMYCFLGLYFIGLWLIYYVACAGISNSSHYFLIAQFRKPPYHLFWECEIGCPTLIVIKILDQWNSLHGSQRTTFTVPVNQGSQSHILSSLASWGLKFREA